MTSSLAARWMHLREDLPASTRLLAVSKGHPSTSIRALAQLGQRAFGESRLQEALPKQEDLGDLDIDWHFIGRLQSNKVRSVVKAFSVIHSVDSLALAERVSRISAEEQVSPSVLLQVKLRPDPSKGGFDANHLQSVWPQISTLPAMRIVGLMTMAPLDCLAVDRQALFRECRDLADRLALPDCSMGMSGDWREATAAGSTWLRVGSALFGARPVSAPAMG